jgi:peptidylprolyl isomerase
MKKRDAYKLENEEFLRELAEREGIKTLPKGILYEVIQEGAGKSPSPNSLVSVFYKGKLISGKVFDNNTRQGYPDAFRLRDLITGWQIALTQMHVGDKWRIYLPAEMGYGSRGTHGIPGHSVLIFEIELVSIG